MPSDREEGESRQLEDVPGWVPDRMSGAGARHLIYRPERCLERRAGLRRFDFEQVFEAWRFTLGTRGREGLTL